MTHIIAFSQAGNFAKASNKLRALKSYKQYLQTWHCRDLPQNRQFVDVYVFNHYKWYIVVETVKVKVKQKQHQMSLCSYWYLHSLINADP